MNTGKSILVTGAAGFIGSRFIQSCNTHNIPVVSILSVDHLDHFKSRNEHNTINFGQIIDRKDLIQWLESSKPVLSAIVHLGACTDTTEMNVEYFRKMNLDYSKSLWSHACSHQIPLVYASSAATYGDGSMGYEDNEEMIPQLMPLNPYGQSKQDFDVWALNQEKAGKAPPSWSGFKFFNVYGFGERHKGKMASVVMHAFDQINRYGFVKLFRSHRLGIPDGHQKRDFIYVDDVVDVLHFALNKKLKRGIFNLGTGQARTYLDLVRAVFKSLSRNENIQFIDTPAEIRERYQYFTQATMDRLIGEGYNKPFTPLEKGVDQYIKLLLSQI